MIKRDFWQEVKHCKPGKHNVPPVIDGVHGGVYIARMWGSKFRVLLFSWSWYSISPGWSPDLQSLNKYSRSRIIHFLSWRGVYKSDGNINSVVWSLGICTWLSCSFISPWYLSQHLWVNWSGHFSEQFQALQGFSKVGFSPQYCLPCIWMLNYYPNLKLGVTFTDALA